MTLECARIHPQCVASIMLVAPAGVGRKPHIMMRLPAVPYLGEFLTKPDRKGIERLWRLAVADPSLITKAFVETKFQFASAPGALAAFLKTLRGFGTFSGFPPEQTAALARDMKAMNQPTLVVWGRRDKFLSCAHADILRANLPNVRVEIFENCGHIPQFERPQVFNETVTGFLAERNGRVFDDATSPIANIALDERPLPFVDPADRSRCSHNQMAFRRR